MVVHGGCSGARPQFRSPKSQRLILSSATLSRLVWAPASLFPAASELFNHLSFLPIGDGLPFGTQINACNHRHPPRRLLLSTAGGTGKETSSVITASRPCHQPAFSCAPGTAGPSLPSPSPPPGACWSETAVPPGESGSVGPPGRPDQGPKALWLKITWCFHPSIWVNSHPSGWLTHTHTLPVTFLSTFLGTWQWYGDRWHVIFWLRQIL